MEQRDTQEFNTSTNGQTELKSPLDAFHLKHSSMSVIVKKIEKISTAIYMVTDFVPDGEPLRNKLRSLSLSLISDSRKIGLHSVEPQYKTIEEVRSNCEEILVLVNLSATVGLVSEMNAKIIKNELEKVRTSFDSLYGGARTNITTHPGYANVVLSSDMFEVPTPAKNFLKKSEEPSLVLYKGQKDNRDVLYKTNNNNGIFSTTVTKKLDLGIKIARRNDVLNVIKTNGTASIKDVKLVLKDINEKTIQRELLALVKEGVLKKEGEKRWSTYRIAP